jgi:simple sugar transport system permease protein
MHRRNRRSREPDGGTRWIAVVAVMLGRAAPAGVLLAALLFGLAEAADAAPYVVTLGTLFLSTARRRRTRPSTGVAS